MVWRAAVSRAQPGAVCGAQVPQGRLGWRVHHEGEKVVIVSTRAAWYGLAQWPLHDECLTELTWSFDVEEPFLSSPFLRHARQLYGMANREQK